MSTTQILFNSPALHSLKRDQLVKLCKLHSIKANGKNVELIERLKQYALQLPPEALAAEGSAEELALEVDAQDPIVPASSHEAVNQEDNDVSMEDAQTIPGGFGDEYEPPQQASAPAEDYNMQDVVLTSRFSVPRPSEQWEVVMEDIEEVDESRNGTMSSKSSLRTISNGEFGTHSSKGECIVFDFTLPSRYRRHVMCRYSFTSPENMILGLCYNTSTSRPCLRWNVLCRSRQRSC